MVGVVQVSRIAMYRQSQRGKETAAEAKEVVKA